VISGLDVFLHLAMLVLLVVTLIGGMVSWIPMSLYFFKFLGKSAPQESQRYKRRFIVFAIVFLGCWAVSWTLFRLLDALLPP
jgi:hypothetical protein